MKHQHQSSLALLKTLQKAWCHVANDHYPLLHSLQISSQLIPSNQSQPPSSLHGRPQKSWNQFLWCQSPRRFDTRLGWIPEKVPAHSKRQPLAIAWRSLQFSKKKKKKRPNLWRSHFLGCESSKRSQQFQVKIDAEQEVVSIKKIAAKLCAASSTSHQQYPTTLDHYTHPTNIDCPKTGRQATQLKQYSNTEHQSSQGTGVIPCLTNTFTYCALGSPSDCSSHWRTDTLAYIHSQWYPHNS